MIERDPDEGGFYVCCDFCSNDINIRQNDFMKAIEVLKMRGWKVIFDGQATTKAEQWLHKCPTCQKK